MITLLFASYLLILIQRFSLNVNIFLNKIFNFRVSYILCLFFLRYVCSKLFYNKLSTFFIDLFLFFMIDLENFIFILLNNRIFSYVYFIEVLCSCFKDLIFYRINFFYLLTWLLMQTILNLNLSVLLLVIDFLWFLTFILHLTFSLIYFHLFLDDNSFFLIRSF